LPLHLSLTCSNPKLGDGETIVHCARCNKCRERHEAFIDAGIPDSTLYAMPLE
jgi:7-cyano-7-deazaguanine synthase